MANGLGITSTFKVYLFPKYKLRVYVSRDCTLTGNSSCEYVPYINNPDIKSSLMYQPEIESVNYSLVDFDQSLLTS